MEKIKQILESVEFEVVEKDDVKILKSKDEDAFVEAVKAVNPEITKKLLKELDKIQDAYLEMGLDLAKNKAVEEFRNDTGRVEVVLPFGVNKSDTVTYDITKERTFSIPGKDTKITKPVIKMEVKKAGCKISKSKIKALEEDIAETLGIK